MNKYAIRVGGEPCEIASKDFVFDTNKTIEEIEEAYEKSCHKFKICFDINDSTRFCYEGVCVEYCDKYVSYSVREILTNAGLDFGKYYSIGAKFGFRSVKSFAELVLDFIGLSLEGFEYNFECEPKRILERKNIGYGIADLDNEWYVCSTND
jgi:hypothetical protein